MNRKIFNNQIYFSDLYNNAFMYDEKLEDKINKSVGNSKNKEEFVVDCFILDDQLIEITSEIKNTILDKIGII